MKKIYTIILVALAALISIPAFADGYTPEQKAAVSATKTVTPIGDSSEYLLNLETFVKGQGLNSTAKSSDMDIILVLDVSGSMEGTKMTNLISAAKGFVDIIKADGTKHSATHRISIVKFACNKNLEIGDNKGSYNGYSNMNYSQVVLDYTDATTAGVSTLKTAIGKLTAAGATHSDYGMQLAQNVISGTGLTSTLKGARTDAIKTVVMFTDGTPTSGSSFEDSVANGAVTAAKTMKGNGVIVYTIGLFDNGTASSTKVTNYMNAVSSNYPNATSYTSRGTRVSSDKDYYYVTTDPNDLAGIFSKIGEDISKANAGINLKKDEVVLKDIITPSFTLPEGASSITVKVATIDQVQTQSATDPTITGYTWKDETVVYSGGRNVSTVEAYKDIAVAVSTDGKTIDVTGFDFSTYWVGPDITKSGTSVTKIETHPNGKKLIIQIAIQFDPNATESGKISTNGEGSAVYAGDVEIAKYQVEPADVFTPLALVIKKGDDTGSGLLAGESILYTIERGTGEGSAWTKDTTFETLTIAVSATNTAAITETLGKLSAKYFADGQYVDYVYRVTEDYTWAWAHKSTTGSVVTQKLFNSDTDYTSKTFVFSKAPDTSNSVNHAEDNKANELAK